MAGLADVVFLALDDAHLSRWRGAPAMHRGVRKCKIRGEPSFLR
jgi:hypothetical protein